MSLDLFFICLLLPFAVVLELAWRSRTIDEHGNLRPSLREQAMAERYRRAIQRYEQRRRPKVGGGLRDRDHR